MILARTLRRTFLLQGLLPEDCLAFLHADPQLPAPTERTETIAVEARDDGLYALRCSWGYEATGSARTLTRRIDETIYRMAAADEGSSLALNASAMRLGGHRVLLVAENGVYLSDITAALLVKGAAFEGTGLVFVRAEGIVAHPAKPHLRAHLLASAGLSHGQAMVAALQLDADNLSYAIDPRIAGAEWRVAQGPVPLLLFVERNDHGRPAIARLRVEAALTRLMRSIRSAQRPDVREFVRLRGMVDQARTFRVAMGEPIATAALIIEQMPQMLIDG